MKFQVYNHRFTAENGEIILRKFVVIMQNDGTLRFTDFHRYIRNPNKINSLTDEGVSRFDFIIPMLNYLFVYRKRQSLLEMTVEDIQEYINSYAQGTLPWDEGDIGRQPSTVQRAMNYILDFIVLVNEDAKVKKVATSISTKNLYRTVEKRDKYGRVIFTKQPCFEVRCKSKPKLIYRDMPNVAFDYLFSYIARNYPSIFGVTFLSAFAGLRPSEACNVRRTDSPLGPGIRFEMKNGNVTGVTIDLSLEYCLRSDLKSVGSIKKERVQRVPDIFLRSFVKAYNYYQEKMAGTLYEKDYAPFSVNSRGMALTYDLYYIIFGQVIEEVIPKFLASDNHELVTYGRILQEHRISPHIFRHWFTVQLVLSGINDIGVLMSARGDRNPESALTYLNNKGELDRQYKKVNSETFDYIQWAAKEKH